jgi:hypothetical protein
MRKGSGTFDADWKRFDMAFDPALELEGWMSSEEHFGVNQIHHEKEQEIPFQWKK